VILLPLIVIVAVALEKIVASPHVRSAGRPRDHGLFPGLAVRSSAADAAQVLAGLIEASLPAEMANLHPRPR